MFIGPLVQKKPLGRCTAIAATNRRIAAATAAGRVNRPMAMVMLSKNSTPPTSGPTSYPGSNPILVKPAMVASRPRPPNRPNSFCAPWGTRTKPVAKRISG